MSTPFAFRMDFVDADKEPLVKWLDSSACSYLVVHETHDGENPHVHVVFHSGKKLSALRMDFKRKFPTKIGNGGYSMKECDDDVEAYMRYMCKGDSSDDAPVVLACQGLEYSSDKVAAAHAAYWVNNEALKSNAQKRKKLVKPQTVIEQLEAECKEKGYKTKEQIAAWYIRKLRDARKPINIFSARAIVNTVWVLVDGSEAAIDQLANSIAY